MPPREPKLQCWTDLIAALLRRHYVATFEELARDIPAYSDTSKKHDAIMRMFERDKDEPPLLRHRDRNRPFPGR